MIYAADVVVPVTHPPLQDGAVLIKDGRIEAVGTRIELASAYPKEELHEFIDALIMPGLVNLHGHLELASFGDLAQPTPFIEWLGKIIAVGRQMERKDWFDASKHGVELYLASGITCAADISRSGGGFFAIAESKMPAVVYIEAVAIDSTNLATSIVELLEQIKSAELMKDLGNFKIGLSPHSPYALSAGALRACAELSEEYDLPLSIHLAETKDEIEMIENGTGSLADIMGQKLSLEVVKMRGFHKTPVEFLDGVHLISNVLIAAHGVWLTDGDIELLKARDASLAVCPTSNELLGVGEAPIAKFVRHGLRFGFGTDSIASNPELDLFVEARKARSLLTKQTGLAQNKLPLSSKNLVEKLTVEAARMLGFANELGSIEPGKRADLLVIDYDSAADADPYDYLIDNASKGLISETILNGKRVYSR